jgi:hypothetical protein
MTKDEALAMDLALEALEDLQRQYSIYPNSFWDWSKGRKAITAIKQALAAPVQVLQRYSPDGAGAMEVDSLGAYVKHQDAIIAPPAQPAPVQEWMKPHPKCDQACLFQCTKGFTQFPECATTQPAAKRQSENDR